MSIKIFESKGQAILVLKDPFFPSPEVYVIEFGILCVKLYFEGIVISVMFLVMIEASCPLVIWFEYHFT